MPKQTRIACVALASLAVMIGVLVSPRMARADDTIKHPGDHPSYTFEIEPHLALGWYNDIYGGSSYGIGVRGAVPLVKNGFVPEINNSVAIGFGLDILRYSNCYYASADCGAWYIHVPVVMQWNFFVAQKWSVFGEPGLYVYKGFLDACPVINQRFGCTNPSDFGIRPALYLGGRYHVNEHFAVTMRVGYPTISIGASWFLGP